MKRIVPVLLILSLTALPLAAAPTDDEVAASFSGVFGVYGAIVVATLMQQSIDGATLELDSQTGASSLRLDNLDVQNLMSGVGVMMADEGEAPEIPFTRISGLFETDADGDLTMDVRLTGGPVRTLKMEVVAGEMVSLQADGRSYIHLKDVFDYAP